MGKYNLYCPGCKITFDDVFSNLCPRCGNDGPLVKAQYETDNFQPLALDNFWKFRPWLPCEGWPDMIKSKIVVYKSIKFAKELGLKNLYIAFNGYWPEKNANMVTCTFKELEAPPTFQRAVEKRIGNLIIASAGNTARAFIYTAKYFDLELYVVVPKNALDKLVLSFEAPENVTIIVIDHNSDYTDSIMFADRMSNNLKITPEGGARNIARRDGMGTVMLESALHMNRLPEHYFQAVGSGTGAIAALEASERLLNSGNFSGPLQRLHLAQNKPFIPLVDAWKKHSNELASKPETVYRKEIDEVYAKVLTNRHPPYSVGGGVYDILCKSNGIMYGITNSEAKSAGKLFESTEGIDLVPAACVGAGSLVQAVENSQVAPDDVILLNITGGGEDRLWEDFDKINVEADIVCSDTIDLHELKEVMEVRIDK